MKVLYKRAEVNPATAPNNEKINNIPIINDPRFAGLRNPTAANTIKNKALMTICIPVPMNTQNIMGYSIGGRKISAWTNFQPVSSRSSAFSSSVGT